MRLTNDKFMTVAGHRGDSYNYYENTLTSFKMAIQNGADMIETDVRLSKDGYLVLIHDDKVDRTTNSRGYVKDMELAELRKLNCGDSHNYEQIPTLKELFDIVKNTDITLNIEIKEYYYEGNIERCEKCIDDVLSLVEEYGFEDRILINSFDAYVLEYVYKKHGKKYLLHGFYPYWEMKNVTIAPEEYLYCACIFDTENKALYDYLIEHGIEPWVGASVTQKSKLSICVKYGAKLITTNNPKDIEMKLEEIYNGNK